MTKMKRLKFFLFSVFTSILLSVSFFACAGGNTEPVIRPISEDILSATRGSIIYYPSGEIRSGVLSSDLDSIVINDVSFRPGSRISFYRNGRVMQGSLASDITIGGINYAAFVNDAGNNIFFHDNGQVSRGVLDGDQTIHGVPFRADTSLSSYENGTVREGVLRASWESYSVNFRSNSTISFYENIQIRRGIFNFVVKQGRLDGNYRIGNTLYSNGHWIRFNNDGTVNSSSSRRDSSF